MINSAAVTRSVQTLDETPRSVPASGKRHSTWPAVLILAGITMGGMVTSGRSLNPVAPLGVMMVLLLIGNVSDRERARGVALIGGLLIIQLIRYFAT